jgi:toxin ParE1/3/4
VAKYRVSRLAKEDIQNIGQYTQNTWGAAQRRQYLAGLEQRLVEIAVNPNLLAERMDFDPPVRIMKYGRHLIIYVHQDLGVLIVRVLHESMDLPAQLSSGG